jgi:hypothetical protein
MKVSYIIRHKSDGVPGLRPGAAALFRVGKARECQICTNTVEKTLSVVTKVGAVWPGIDAGSYLCLFRTGASVSSLQGRAFLLVHKAGKDKGSPCRIYGRE